MENPLNKNIIRFNVAGAIDFTETLTFEIHNEKVDGSEEIPINDITHALWELYPVIGHYLEWQVRVVAIDHHFNVRPKNVWVKCVRFYHHSHDHSFYTDKNYYDKHNKRLTFKEAIEELKSEHSGYELDYYVGYDFKTHVNSLRSYFGDKDLIVHGKTPEQFFEKKEKITV